MNKKLATVMAATMAIGSITTGVVSAATTEKKLVGENRIDTAIKISKKGWSKADTVILVNDSAIPDALSATPFADEKDAPILLTSKKGLNQQTAEEIKRLGAKNAILIGGTAVLPTSIEDELKALNVNSERISGETREETALEIAKRLDGIKDVSEIAVVNGTTGLADAVSVASAAAEKDMPILLASLKKGLETSNKFINEENIKASYIIGGTKAVPEIIVSKLPGKQRIQGDNRNDTNAKVIEKFYTNEKLNNIYLAKDGMGNNNQLIDALAVGVLASKNDSPVLIASNKLSETQKNVIKNKKLSVITQVGGNGNEKAFAELKSIFNPSTANEIVKYDGSYDSTPLDIELESPKDNLKFEIYEKESGKKVNIIKDITIENDSLDENNYLYSIKLKQILTKGKVYEVVATDGNKTEKVEISTNKDYVYIPISNTNELYDINKYEGKTVVLEMGTYDLEKQVKVNKSLEIIGGDSAAPSVLRPKDDVNWEIKDKKDSSIVLIENANNVNLSWLEISEARNAKVGNIQSDGVGVNIHNSNVNMEKVTSMYNDCSGILVNGSTLNADGIFCEENGVGAINVEKENGLKNNTVVKIKGAEILDGMAVYSNSTNKEYLSKINLDIRDYDNIAYSQMDTVGQRTVWKLAK